MDKKENFYQETIVVNHHERLEKIFLSIRNIAVALTFILFLSSVFGAPHPFLLKAIAYFCGMVAYFSELVLLTDGFKSKIPMREMFMAYVFTPMYMMLGISYLIEHFE